jgi:hypothetical protein
MDLSGPGIDVKLKERKKDQIFQKVSFKFGYQLNLDFFSKQIRNLVNVGHFSSTDPLLFYPNLFLGGKWRKFGSVKNEDAAWYFQI